MPTVDSDAETILDLRQRALSQLAGARPPAPGRPSPAAALAVLHTLASSPTTAADALALLHELQVHQIELELQDEELRRSRGELEAELSRQKALFDLAPVAYLTLDTRSCVHELNHAAARLLDAPRDTLQGALLTSFLSSRSAQVLITLLAGVHDGALPQTCELQLAADPAPALLAVASADPAGGGRCLLALVEPGARSSVGAG